METGRKAEGTLLLWCCYHLFSPQLSKEALKQTYTDSSKRLKWGPAKGHVFVLLLNKSLEDSGRIPDDYLKLYWYAGIN